MLSVNELVGMWVSNADNLATGNIGWLIDDGGQWNQLQASGSARTELTALPIGSRLRVIGNWVAGGIAGLGAFNVTQATKIPALTTPAVIAGVLSYDFKSSSTVILYTFYVTDDLGVKTQLNLSNEAYAQALGLQGRRVHVNGTWSTASGAFAPQFYVDGIQTLSSSLLEFTGVLVAMTSVASPTVPVFPGYPQMGLLDDTGKVSFLHIPPALNALAQSIVGSRIRILAFMTGTDSLGRDWFDVSDLSEISNALTDIQVIGLVSGIAPKVPGQTSTLAYIQPDSGGAIPIRLSAALMNSVRPIEVGYRIVVTGTWSPNGENGVGEILVRIAPTIISPDFDNLTSVVVKIIGIGAFGDTLSCPFKQLIYLAVDGAGKSFTIALTAGTNVTGLENGAVNFKWGDRVQVSGVLEVSGGLTARSMTLLAPDFANESTTLGTVTWIGPVGDTFNCTGPLYSYSFLDDNGSRLQFSVPSSSFSFYKIGERLQITGVRGTNYISPRQIVSVSPGKLESVFQGVAFAKTCTGNATDSFVFVDYSGTEKSVGIYYGQLRPPIVIGDSYDLVGTYIGAQLSVRLISPLPTVASLPPIINGTITAVGVQDLLGCSATIYNYSFKADTGEIRQLRVPMEAFPRGTVALVVGDRIGYTSKLAPSADGVIHVLTLNFIQ